MIAKNIAVIVDQNSFNISSYYRPASPDLIFFLHGLGCSKDSFEDVWSFRNFEDFSLLSFDLLGFGSSDKPIHFSYSLEDHARVCEAVVRSFPASRLHIVAHSLGGAVGLLLSDHIFSQTVSFVNIEGNLIGRDCGFVSRQTIDVPYNTVENKLFADFQFRLKTKKLKHLFLDKASPHAFYKSAESLVAWSDSGRLLEIFNRRNCKKAYVYGRRNSGMKVLAELDANIQKKEISKSGHFPMNENPAEFYSTLHAFLTLS